MSRSWQALLVDLYGDQEYIDIWADTMEAAARHARAKFSGSIWVEVTVYGDADPIVVALDDETGDSS